MWELGICLAGGGEGLVGLLSCEEGRRRVAASVTK